MKRVILYGGAGIIALVGVYLLATRKQGESAGATVGRLAVGTVVDAGVGAVKGIGSVFGVPDTNMTQCQRDIANGDTWASSFSCPASEFIGSVFNSSNIKAAEVNDLRQIDRIIERQQADYAAKDAYYAGASWGPIDGRTGRW